MVEKVFQNFFNLWQPSDFLIRAVRIGRKEYDKGLGSIMFLLVRLLNEPDSLAQGLARAFYLPKFNYHFSDNLASNPEIKRDDALQSQISQLKTDTTIIGMDEMVVEQSMISEPHFVIPIEKRDSVESDIEVVKVGRTSNNDIIFKHPSVSKFHAMFYFDQVGAIGLEDADIKNKTWVNGEKITKRIHVVSGDSIRFGSVDTVLCNASTLRNTLEMVIAQIQ